MNVTVGSDSGVIKIYNIKQKVPVGIYGKIQNAADKELYTMTYGWDNNETELIQGYKDGVVKMWSVSNEGGNTLGEIKMNSAVRAISTMSDRRLLLGCEDGTISLQKVTSDGDAKQLTQMNFAKSLYALKFDSENPHRMAAGGKNADLAVYDIEKKTPLWRAKNAPNDKLGIAPLIWVTDLEMIGTDKIVTGTGYSEMRVYDCRKNRTPPVINIKLSRHPIQSIKYNSNQFENTIIIADSVGNVSSYDIRNGKSLGAYKGNTGSVRSIDIHPTLPLLATVGLDRHLRVFDINTRKCLQSVYLKQKLSSVLFSSEEPPEEPEEPEYQNDYQDEYDEEEPEQEGDAVDDEENEQIWNQIEANTTAAKKKSATIKKEDDEDFDEDAQFDDDEDDDDEGEDDDDFDDEDEDDDEDDDDSEEEEKVSNNKKRPLVLAPSKLKQQVSSAKSILQSKLAKGNIKKQQSTPTVTKKQKK